MKQYLLSMIFLLNFHTFAHAFAQTQTNTETQPETLNINKILSVTIDSSINPATYSHLETAYKHAETNGFSAILIRLNTPGGLVTTTKDMLTTLGKSKLPTFVWIYPEGASATSAGAILASGAHVLAMSSGTNIGAATPVQLSKGLDDGDLRKKAINDLVALVQSLSESRGRNAALFGKMVQEAASFKTQEALESKLVDFIADNEKEFLEKTQGLRLHLQGKKYQLVLNSQTSITEFPMDMGQRLLNVLASPNLSYILFLLGAALIYLEFQTSGFIAGSIGAVCLVLAGIGFQVLPLNLGALGLIILAFIMFLLETYFTSHGLLSIAGLLSLLTGSLFLYRTNEAYIELSRSLVYTSFTVVALFVGAMLFYLFRERRQQKIPKDYYSLVGKEAVVLRVLTQQEPGEHHYQIKVAGEIWQAKSHHEYHEGDSCTVKADSHDMILRI
jgi:membrane-bound serine protease (ClpP class)